MEDKTKKLMAYLDLIGVKIDSSSFESRIKAQKLVYIVQKIIGKELYSNFSFYIRGPYSRELAREYFENKEELVNSTSNYRIDKQEREELERVKPILSKLSQAELEIVASLLFLRTERGMDENLSEIDLHMRKPYLKPEDIWRGSILIKKLFLTEKLRATIMNSLDKEIDGWNSMSEESLKRFE